MPDFTSSLYLGLRHPSMSLGAWARLTAGAPAALGEPPVAGRVARSLAALVGAERAVVATSTLHLAWDIGGMLGHMRATVCIDDSTYPILGWAGERAAGLGASVLRFRHHDPEALRRRLTRRAGSGGASVILTDGYCPRCAAVAPLTAYSAIAREHGGFVIVDDTQALGVLGSARTAEMPYGTGGAGSLAWLGASDLGIARVMSLAKGFGAPMAALAGSAAFVARVVAASETRVHCSPPDLASLRAAEHSLAVNAAEGDALRRLLLARVRRFRGGALRAGIALEPGIFPIQMVREPRGDDAASLHARLAANGVRAVLTGAGDARDRASGRVTFVLTARHSAADVDEAIAALRDAYATRTLLLTGS